MKQVWQTTDEQIFEDRDEAEAHESADFELWFKHQTQLVEISKTLNDDSKDEIYDTDRAIFKSLVHEYYENYVYEPGSRLPQ
jgi:hypothetical protein